MTGRRYYITSLADWQRHAARFTHSHWLALEAVDSSTSIDPSSTTSGDSASVSPGEAAVGSPSVGARHAVPASADSTISDSIGKLSGATRILVLIEADEGAHLALEDDATFEPLPHPLASKSISETAQSALAQHGVLPGATTFDATEAVARAHPLLRHRVF